MTVSCKCIWALEKYSIDVGVYIQNESPFSYEQRENLIHNFICSDCYVFVLIGFLMYYMDTSTKHTTSEEK